MTAVAIALEETGLGPKFRLRGEGRRGGEDCRVKNIFDMNDMRFT